jgi:O-antigen/teichoic acid export membrane protein
MKFVLTRTFFKNFFLKNQFTKNVITLIAGTGLAQLIPILFSPLITRLYSPEDFGEFGLYASICAILIVLVTGKYELSIVIAKQDVEAVNLLAVTVVFSVFSSLFIYGFIALFGKNVSLVFDNPAILNAFYLVPLTTLILGCYYGLNYWVNRKSRYRDMAQCRVLQGGTSVAFQILAGFSKFGFLGLIVGQLIGQLLATLFLVRSLVINDSKLFRRISIRRMVWAIRKNLNYPRYMMPGQLISVSSNELPILLLTIFYGVGVAGLYALSQRIMAIPLTLVANAFGDVYRQIAAQHYAEKGECKSIFVNTLMKLIFL